MRARANIMRVMAVLAALILSQCHTAIAGLDDVYWSPTNLAGTLVWLDASDTNTLWADTAGATQATTTVARWDDKSGGTNHFYQSDLAKQPNGTTPGRTINGLNALDFDGDDMYSSGNPFGVNISDAFLFLVSLKDAGGERWDEYIDIGGGGAWHLELSSWNNPDYRPMFITAGGNNLQLSNSYANIYPDPLKDRVSLFGLYDSVSDDVKQIWIDSVKGSEAASPGVSTTGGNMYLGQLPSVSRASFDGLFGEIVVISGTVSTQERETVEGYLAWKWEFVERLERDHLYKYAIPGLPIHFSNLGASNITTTNAVLFATANTSLTSATVVWDTTDKGTTNLSDWAAKATATGATPGLVTAIATNLTQDTEYYYRFYGDDGSTNGWTLTMITFRTDLTPANIPVFTSVTSTHNSVTLEWTDNAATESNYLLYRSRTNGASYHLVAVLDENTTNYVDWAVAVPRTYYYRLAATNTMNDSSTDPAACETNAPPTALSSNMILYESFEEPIVDGEVWTPPTGWESVTGNDAGLSDSGTATGKTGDQFGQVFRNGGTLLTTTNLLTNALTAGINYTITCDLGFERDEATYATTALMAGTNVIAISTNVCPNGAGDAYVQSMPYAISITFLAFPDNPYLGETLGIRLSGDYWRARFDDLCLYATSTTDDFTPPTPTNMVWAGLPTSSVSNGIAMQAVTAVDMNGVQYFFTNVTSGSTSGWQDSPIWTETDLTPGDTYSYMVKARDKSVNTNETGWSSVESAECEAHIIFYSSLEEPSILPNTTLGFGTLPLPPAEWSSSASALMYHDSHGTYSDTPFGEQYAGVRPNGSHNLTADLGGHALWFGYTYRVTCNVGSTDGSGTPQPDRWARITLMAGVTAVATNSVLPTSNDMSETNALEFVPASGHPNLGEVITLKLDGHPDFHQDKVIFDNIKVYAIPPKMGTVFSIF